jgi:DNA-binding protein HU-beta
MNKAEYINAVAEKSGLSKTVATDAVNASLEVLTEQLAKGETVSFVGFGSFETKNRAARIGKNPRTKEEIQIPATTVPNFKAGKALKDAVAK